MGYLLATLSALIWGAGDFCGGKASEKSPATVVTFWSQLLGIVVLVVALVAMPGSGPTPHVLGWGAAGGIGGAIGIMTLYRALSIGAMSIVSPVAAAVSAAVPLLFGVLVRGERPSLVACLGIALALIAIVLVTGDEGEAANGAVNRVRAPGVTAKRRDAPVVVLAIVAGVGFGAFFVGMAKAGDAAVVGLWPLAGARGASLLFEAFAVAVSRTGFALPRSSFRVVLMAGCFDQLANVLYYVSLGRGLVSVIAVLASLYPVSTVTLAFVVDRERLHRRQQVGLLFAMVGIAAITA